jgi:hypothetical protein
MTYSSTTPLLLLFVVALTALLSSADAAKRGYYRHAQVERHASNYHRLHDLLSIGNDPNQDIRTNVLLNMEGI